MSFTTKVKYNRTFKHDLAPDDKVFRPLFYKPGKLNIVQLRVTQHKANCINKAKA